MAIKVTGWINSPHELSLADMFGFLKSAHEGQKLTMLQADDEEPRDPLHSVTPYGAVIVMYTGEGPTSELKREFLRMWNEE
jgi:hypothetical protein